MKEFGSYGGEDALSTIRKKLQCSFFELDGKEMKNIKIAALGAGLGGRFNHISELKVMKFKETMNRPDSNKWKEKIKNEDKEW